MLAQVGRLPDRLNAHLVDDELLPLRQKRQRCIRLDPLSLDELQKVELLGHRDLRLLDHPSVAISALAAWKRLQK